MGQLTIDIETFSQRKTNLVYPYILIKEMNDATKCLIDNLEEGDIMLICNYKGKRKKIKSISQSAYNIQKLLRVHKDGLIYAESESNEREINKIEDYMEVFKWTY